MVEASIAIFGLMAGCVLTCYRFVNKWWIERPLERALKRGDLTAATRVGRRSIALAWVCFGIKPDMAAQEMVAEYLVRFERFEEAHQLYLQFEHSLPYRRRLHGEFIRNENRAICRIRCGALTSVPPILAEMESFCRSRQEQKGLLRDLASVHALYWQVSGKFEKAAELSDQALLLAGEAGQLGQLSVVQLYRSDLELARRHPAQALHFAREALDFLQRSVKPTNPLRMRAEMRVGELMLKAPATPAPDSPHLSSAMEDQGADWD